MAVESPPPPDWLVWAAGLAIAACLGVALALFRRRQRGEPAVDPRPHRPVPWEGSDVVLVVIGFFLLAVAMGSFLGARPEAGEPPLDLVLAGNLLLMAAATFLAGGWLVARGSTPADLGLAGDRPAADLGLAVAGLALVVAPLLGLAAGLARLVPYEHPVVAFLAERRDFQAVLLVVLTAVVAAPLAEEFFFRRVLQGWLEKRLPAHNAAGAIALSAAAFALAHQGQGLAFVPLFPLGIVLGYLVRQTGSLLPAILLHAFFNAVSIAIVLASPNPIPAPQPAESPGLHGPEAVENAAGKPLWPPGGLSDETIIRSQEAAPAPPAGPALVRDPTSWPPPPPARLSPACSTWPPTRPSGSRSA